VSAGGLDRYQSVGRGLDERARTLSKVFESEVVYHVLKRHSIKAQLHETVLDQTLCSFIPNISGFVSALCYLATKHPCQGLRMHSTLTLCQAARCARCRALEEAGQPRQKQRDSRNKEDLENEGDMKRADDDQDESLGAIPVDLSQFNADGGR